MDLVRSEFMGVCVWMAYHAADLKRTLGHRVPLYVMAGPSQKKPQCPNMSQFVPDLQIVAACITYLTLHEKLLQNSFGHLHAAERGLLELSHS